MSQKFRAPVHAAAPCQPSLVCIFTHGHHDQHMGVFLMLRGRAHCRLSECRRRGLPVGRGLPGSGLCVPGRGSSPACGAAVHSASTWVAERKLSLGGLEPRRVRLGMPRHCQAWRSGPRSRAPGPRPDLSPICRNRGLIPARGSHRGVCGQSPANPRSQSAGWEGRESGRKTSPRPKFAQRHDFEPRIERAGVRIPDSRLP